MMLGYCRISQIRPDRYSKQAERRDDIHRRNFTNNNLYLINKYSIFFILLYLLVGVSLEPLINTSTCTEGISIATVKEMLRMEVALQLDYLKDDDNYFQKVCKLQDGHR